MNTYTLRLLTVGLIAFTSAALMPLKAQSVWNNGADDSLWSNVLNWNSGLSPVVVGPTATVTIQTQPSTDTIGIDTGAPVTIASLNFTLTTNPSADTSMLLEAEGVETLTVNGAITNSSSEAINITLPVTAGASATYAGGTGSLNFGGGLTVGANTIATTGTVSVSGSLVFAVNSTTSGQSNATFGTIGSITTSNATQVSVDGTYTNNATLANDTGDFFKLTSGTFSGATVGSLQAFNDTNLAWVSTLIQKGILFVEPSAGGTVINSGVTLPIGNDTEFNPSGSVTTITLNGGELLTSNDGALDTGGTLNAAFSSSRNITINHSTSSTLAATTGTTATYSGILSDSGGGTAGTLTIGASGNTGTVVLSGPSTYAGATTVAFGTLGVANSTGSATGSGAVSLNSGAALQGAAGSSISGQVNLAGSNTISSTSGTLTIGSLNVTGAGNTLSGGTVAGNATQNAASALAVNGTLTGTDSLTAGTTALSGTGTISGAVTLNGGGNTVSSSGTLATGGITVNGAGNTISSGTVSGAITQNSSSTLTVNGTASGSDSLHTSATLSGAGTVGAVTLAGGNTVSSTGTLATGGITVSGTGNTIGTGTVTGAITQNTGSALTVSGAAGSDALASGATLTGSGSGSVGAVTLAGTDTLGGPLITTGITVSGIGNTISTGTVTGAVTFSGTSALAVNGTAGGTIAAGSGATLSGTGTTGAVTLTSGGAINLTDGVIGTLTVGGLSTTAGALTFEIGGGTTNTDKIADSGTLTVGAGSTTITIGNLGGTGQTLALGTYDLITYTGTATGLGNLTLSTSSLDGKSLSLVDVANIIELQVSAAPPTNGQYSLATTVTGNTNVHINGTTTLATTITNTGTGTQDTLNYTGLSANPGSGSVNTGSGPNGTALGQGSNGQNPQTFTAGATGGTVTINPSVGTVTNTTATGTPTLSGSTGTSVAVYTGQSTWAGTGTGGSWGTLVGTGANAFGLNWGANQGSPGLDAGFTSTDTATFTNVGGQATETVSLNGASPSLLGITFNAAATNYTLAQGTGGTITLNGGGGNATVTVTAGTHTISAPVVLATNTNVAVASGQQVTFSGNITGTGGLTSTSSGKTILSGTDTYQGTTAVNAGTLVVTGSTLNTGIVTVANGATLAGTGSTGVVTVSGGGAINLQDGAIGTLTVGGLSIGNAGTPSSISFDIGAGATGNLDKIADNGTLVLSGAGGTTINIGNVSGTPTLTNGTYTLISSTGITGVVGDLTLATPVIDGKVLTLSLVGNSVDLTVATETNSYTLGASAATSRIMVNTGTTTITSTITDNDPVGVLTYTGLNLSVTSGGGSLSGGTLPQNGTAQPNGGTSSGTATFTAGSTTGATVITPIVGTVSNTSGTPTLAGTTPVTVDVVAKRTITNGATTNLGLLHNGAAVNMAANAFTSTGLNATTTSVTVAGGSGTADGNGVTLTGGSTSFNGSTLNATGATQTFGGAITNNSGGTTTGSFNLGVTTQENGGAGLTGEGAYSPVAVAYTAIVYTGLSTWAGDGTASGSWGTLAGTGAGTFGANWGAGQGSPGLDPNFVDTDTATFGNVGGQATQTVTLDGASPSLLSLTFDGSTTSYTIAQGSGGTLTFNGGGGSATITDAATGGTQTISAPVVLATNTNVAVSGGRLLTVSGNVTGAGGLTTTGTGTLVLVGSGNTYSGGTTISAGTLQIGDGATSNGSIGTAGVTDNGALAFDPLNASTITNAITGSGSVTQNGPGTTILTGANNYGGATTVTAGKLQIGNGVTGAIANGSAVSVSSGATIAFNEANGSTQTNGIANGGTVAGVEGAGVTNTLSGNITGAGAVTQTGAGTTVLTGTNAYGGGTTISSGMVAVGNLSALGTGNVTVSGGTLAATNGVHSINVGNNYVQSSGILTLNLNATPNGGGLNAANDLLNVTGTATLNGTLALDFTFVPVKGAVFTVVDAAGGIIGTPGPDFTVPNVTPPGYVVTTSETINDDEFQVTIVSTQLGLTSVLGSYYTPNRAGVLNYIDNYITSGPLFTAIGTALTNTNNPAAVAADIADQESPERFSNFVRSTVFNNASFFTQGFDSYLEGQRSAQGDFLTSNGEIDSSGLTVVNSETDPALGQVTSQLLAWSPAALPHGLLSDTTDPVISGIDSKEMTATSSGQKSRDFDVFVLGNVILAQDFSQAEVAHADTTTGTVEVGGDYRITPHLRVGALFGYGHTDATLDDNGSSATVDSYAPAAYATYAENGWYANALGSYGFNNFTEDRHLSIGGVSAVAHGAPSGDQIIGNLDGGYDFHAKNWTFGPTAGVQYTHLDVDSFSEDGADALTSDLNVGKQESDSLRSRLGGHASYAFQTGKITLTPHLDASWQHEFMDQSRGITSQFASVGAGSFIVNTPNPTRDSALIDGGLSADLNRQVSLYLDYMVQAGQSNYFGQSVQAGVKIGF